MLTKGSYRAFNSCLESIFKAFIHQTSPCSPLCAKRGAGCSKSESKWGMIPLHAYGQKKKQKWKQIRIQHRMRHFRDRYQILWENKGQSH